MFCNKCGAEIKDDNKFCPACGNSLNIENSKNEISTINENKTVEPKKGGGKATASLIIGIITIILFLVPILTLPLAIIGLVLGATEKEKSKKKTAGIITNVIGLLGSLILLLAILVMIILGVVNIAISPVSMLTDPENALDKILDIAKDYEKNSENIIDNSKSDDDESLIDKYNSIIDDTIDKYNSYKNSTNTQKIGDDENGYLEIPKDWVKFIDVNVSTGLIQYSDIGELGYIVTMKSFDSGIDPLTATMNIVENIKNEGVNPTYTATTIGNFTGYKISAKYTNGTYIDIYVFKASDNKTHYISIEGPDSSNENFKIPQTFSMTK